MSQEYFVYTPEKNVSTSKCLTKPSLPTAFSYNGARGNSYFTGDLPNIGNFEINETTRELLPSQKPFTIGNCVTYLEKEAQEFLFHNKPLYFSIKGFETKKVRRTFSNITDERRICNLFFWCLNDILIMKYYFKHAEANDETFSVYHLDKKLKKCELLLNIPIHNTLKIPLKTILPVTNTTAAQMTTGDLFDLRIRSENAKDFRWTHSDKGKHGDSLKLCTEAAYYLRNEFADHINGPTEGKLSKLKTGFQYFHINDYANFLLALHAVERLPMTESVIELEQILKKQTQLRHQAHLDYFAGKTALIYSLSQKELEDLIALVAKCQGEMQLRSVPQEVQHAHQIFERLSVLQGKEYSGMELSPGVSSVLESAPINMPRELRKIVLEYYSFFSDEKYPIIQPMLKRLQQMEQLAKNSHQKATLQNYQEFLSTLQDTLKTDNRGKLTELMLKIDSCYLQGLLTSARLNSTINSDKELNKNFKELIKDIYNTVGPQTKFKLRLITSVEVQHIYMKLVEAGGGKEILGKNYYNGERFGRALKGCEIEVFASLFPENNDYNVFIDDAQEQNLAGLLADVDDSYYKQRRELFHDLYNAINKLSENDDQTAALTLYDKLECTNFKVTQEVKALGKTISHAFLTWPYFGSRSKAQDQIVDLFKGYNKQLLALSTKRAAKTASLSDKKSESSQPRKGL